MRVERRDVDAIRQTRSTRRREDEAAPVGKKIRRRNRTIFRRNDHLQLAAGLRDALDSRAHAQQNVSRTIPGAAEEIEDVGERLRRAAVEADFLHLLVREERDRLPVRRPERKGGLLRSGNGARDRGTERAYPDQIPSAGSSADESELASVFGKRDRA